MEKIGNKYQKPIIVLNSIGIHKSKSIKDIILQGIIICKS